MPRPFERIFQKNIAIKICGLATEGDLEICKSNNVDTIGLLLKEEDYRGDMAVDVRDQLTIATAKRLSEKARNLGLLVTLLVKCSAEVELSSIINEIRPDAIQIQKPINLETIRSIATLYPSLYIIKTIKIPSSTRYEVVISKYRYYFSCEKIDAYLLDYKDGGSGRTFDWDIGKKISDYLTASKKKVIVAGGLNSENVVNAINQMQPHMVDVMSGVSNSPGVKCESKIIAFMRSVNSINPRAPNASLSEITLPQLNGVGITEDSLNQDQKLILAEFKKNSGVESQNLERFLRKFDTKFQADIINVFKYFKFLNQEQFENELNSLLGDLKCKLIETQASLHDVFFITSDSITDSSLKMARDATRSKDTLRGVGGDAFLTVGQFIEKSKNTPTKTKNLIFLNDTHGTGNQFIKSYMDFIFSENNRNIYVCGIFITQTAINNILYAFNTIKDDKKSNNRIYFVPDRGNCKSIYNLLNENYISEKFVDYLAEKGALATNEESSLGYKDSGLLVAHYEQCPNNTLGVFWGDGSLRAGTPAWPNLFKYRKGPQRSTVGHQINNVVVEDLTGAPSNVVKSHDSQTQQPIASNVTSTKIQFNEKHKAISEQRFLLQNIAAQYYKRRTNLIDGLEFLSYENEEYALLHKKEWLHWKILKENNGEITISDCLDEEELVPSECKWVDIVDIIKARPLEKTVNNRYLYRLKEINGCKPIFYFHDTPSQDSSDAFYNIFIQSCEAMSWELIDAIANHCDNNNISNLKLFNNEEINKFLNSTGSSLPLRDKQAPITDYYKRCVSAGINTLAVTVRNDGSIYYWMHNRGLNVSNNSKKNEVVPAEAVGSRHVIPAGTFQPMLKHDECHHAEFSIRSNIIREFVEEMYNNTEFQLDAIPKNSPAILNLEHLYSEHLRHKFKNECPNIFEQFVFLNKTAEFVLLGFGLDVVNLKLEILTLCVAMYDPTVFSNKFVITNEAEGGNIVSRPFTKENLKSELSRARLLPAAAGCIVQTLKNFDKITEICKSIASNYQLRNSV